MRIFFSEKEIRTLKKYKEKIEKETNVKLFLLRDYVDFEGDAIEEFEATRIIKAVACGFDLKEAILLKNEEYMFEELNIKDYVRISRLADAKARLIGKEGRAIKNLSHLSHCIIKLHDNHILILGEAEDVDIAEQAVISLIKGSKHGNVYARLEKLQNRFKDEDLGLREWKNKK